MTDSHSEPTVEVDLYSDELAKLAALAADEKQGRDIVILQVGEVLALTEYFVITSASNRRLVRTIADAVEEKLRAEAGRKPLRTEGLSEQEWVLLDYGDIVVHVFGDEQRRFYEIERLYRDVARLEWQPPAPRRVGE
jgi:ribosome-associated protein